MSAAPPRPESGPLEGSGLSRLTGVVLAAGLSRRAAPENKLLLPFRGASVVRATVAAFCAAGLGEVLVVTGHQDGQVRAALNELPVRFVFAPDFAMGVGHSLAAGIRQASQDATGFVVTVGDLPLLSPALVRRIGERFLADGGLRHVVPLAGGRRGHPVVLGAWLRARLEALSGDTGARVLLAGPEELGRTIFLETGDPAICSDVDSAATIAKLART